MTLQSSEDRILVTPSGVLKERLREDDLVTLDSAGERLGEGGGKLSSCWPNFQHVYRLRCCCNPY